jgi:hypothetical protein
MQNPFRGADNSSHYQLSSVEARVLLETYSKLGEKPYSFSLFRKINDILKKNYDIKVLRAFFRHCHENKLTVEDFLD